MGKLTGIFAGLSLLFWIVGLLYGFNAHEGFGLFLALGMFALLFATIISFIIWGIREVIRRNRPEN
jgi:hypothetical protein